MYGIYRKFQQYSIIINDNICRRKYNSKYCSKIKKSVNRQVGVGWSGWPLVTEICLDSYNQLELSIDDN